MANPKKQEELRIITNTLKEQGKMFFLEGATEEQVNTFEKDHDITFPECFKEWLLFSDGGECFLPAGVQFYGVSHKPLINVGNADRPDNRFIVIGSMSFGDPILFEKGSERISIYNHEAGVIEDDETFSDFFEFLKSLYELLEIGG